jgi:hypothetical protein
MPNIDIRLRSNQSTDEIGDRLQIDLRFGDRIITVRRFLTAHETVGDVAQRMEVAAMLHGLADELESPGA